MVPARGYPGVPVLTEKFHIALCAGVVCYRFKPADGTLDEEELESLNAAIQATIVDSGYAMISSTRLHGRYSLRLCIMNFTSTWADVRGTLQRVLDVGHELGLR